MLTNGFTGVPSAQVILDTGTGRGGRFGRMGTMTQGGEMCAGQRVVYLAGFVPRMSAVGRETDVAAHPRDTTNRHADVRIRLLDLSDGKTR